MNSIDDKREKEINFLLDNYKRSVAFARRRINECRDKSRLAYEKGSSLADVDQPESLTQRDFAIVEAGRMVAFEEMLMHMVSDMHRSRRRKSK